MFDVVVIGGGVVGGLILRELTRYDISCAMLEKESDVCMGQSKANSGIVHAGFDAKEGSLKAKFNVLGSNMMPKDTEELGVKYLNNGSLVVAFNDEEKNILEDLKVRGEKNGVTGLEIIDQKTLREKEPNISEEAICALYAPTGGIVCPYDLAIASIGNAMDNGAKLYTSFDVEKIEKEVDGFCLTSAKGEIVKSKIIVNACGKGTQKVANLLGDNSFTVGARKGQYILLDKEHFVNDTLFFTPTKKGKGILVTSTVDGNILLGPTAEECEDLNDTTTNKEGYEFIISKVKKMCRNVPLWNTITSFTGTRIYCDRHDFIIEKSQTVNNLINVAGIESPGLTSSPAIAEYVVNELIGSLIALKPNEKFNPVRKKELFFRNLSTKQKIDLIKSNPAYGKIVCKCEKITEGEIVSAIKSNPPATCVDAIKRRTRAGMGRCQGGFCQPKVAEIIARELEIPFEKVTKSGEGSNLIVGVSK